MLPPLRDLVIEDNPVIMCASQTTANWYLCLFLCEYKFNAEYF